MRATNFLRAILAVVGFVYLPAAAYAQCVIVDKPEALFARSDMVFRGTVVATESTGARGSHQVVDIATLRVAQSWKGEPGHEVRVGADRAFEKDKEYLVFAVGKPLSTSILCRWTEPIERAKPRLDWLLKNRGLLGQAPSIRSPDLRDVTLIEGAVKAAYQREFGRTIEHPAIYNNPEAHNCRDEGHLTTTAYLRTGTTTTLLSMYMSRDAATVIRKTESAVSLLPAGTIRVLVLLLNYPQTVAATALTLWEDAQKEINEDHAAFAKSRGYNGPIVVFDNTNILIDPTRVANPRRPASVRMAAEHEGISTANFQIVMAIDINPEEGAGGYSLPEERAVYVGNYSSWKTLLGAPQWKMIARTAYHHEIAHHWGWPSTHDWAGSCGGAKQDYAPFIAPPTLFGWEDLDGDHVPEILSNTPYGSPR